jgi:adenylosuccinate lyase
MSLTQNAEQTMATQWMERTLDDSANRRLSLPQAFLAIDAVLIINLNIARGLKVFPKAIARRLQEVLPFMATEEILMAGVQQGGDRQELHERIRVHSLASARLMKEEGVPSDLLERLAGDPAFAGIDLTQALDPARFTGRAPQQVEEFLREFVAPVRARYADLLAADSQAELKV